MPASRRARQQLIFTSLRVPMKPRSLLLTSSQQVFSDFPERETENDGDDAARCEHAGRDTVESQDAESEQHAYRRDDPPKKRGHKAQVRLQTAAAFEDAQDGAFGKKRQDQEYSQQDAGIDQIGREP